MMAGRLSIGLLAIMLDESDYLARWVEGLKDRFSAFDAVLVVDGSSSDGTREKLHDLGVPTAERRFADHFADQRNWGAQQLATDWIFEVDADELVSAPLLAGIRDIAADAESSRVDSIGIPRLNFIDGNLVPGPGHQGLDFQYRLHRRSCHWRGAVHEEIVGYRARYELAIRDGHFLIHDKSNARHVSRNTYYRTLAP